MPIPNPPGGQDWRTALAALDPASARGPVTPHAAQLLLARGRAAEAEAAYREYLDRAPDDVSALDALAALLRRTGRPGEAAGFAARAARVRAGRIDAPADDRAGVAEFLLAADQFAPPPAGSPPAFVADLFDRYADGFDEHLRDGLQYRAPEVLFAAVARAAGGMPGGWDVLDLGCGTGLAGEVFRPAARRLDGVDLSPRMVERAAARGVYDALATGELVAHLAAADRAYDLVIAADVFVYLGDLDPVLAGCRRVLRPGGLLAFTVEAADAPGYHLQPVRRYAHHRDYLLGAAARAGLAVREVAETWTRLQGRQPVRSYLCVLVAPAAGVD